MPNMIAGSDKDERQQEFEITPEMIEAGADVCRRLDWLDEISEKDYVSQIYLAMSVARSEVGRR